MSIDQLPAATWLAGPDGGCLSVNRAWLELTGGRPDAQAGQGWLDAVHPDDRDACCDQLAEVLLTGVPACFAFRLRDRRGGYRWFEQHCAPLRAVDGRVDGLLGTCHDVTALRSAEASARLQAVELRELAHTLPALIAHCDMGERYTFANRTYCEAYGHADRPVIGQTVREVIGEDAYRTVSPYFVRVLRGEAVNYQRALVSDGSGPRRVIDAHLIPHFDDEGNQQGAFILASDITRHHRAEQTLRDREERLECFAAAVTDGILFHEHGELIDCNEAALQLFGVASVDTLTDRRISRWIDDGTPSLGRLNADDGRPYEVTGLTSDGRRVPLEIRSHAMPGQRDTDMRMTVVRDISERKVAEARIQFLAHHDGLTRLPNRHQLMEALDPLLAQCQHRGTRAAVLFIDLDRFKTVNDSLGHHAGDLLLRNVANRLRENVRKHDLVARIGGDEFVVVVPDIADSEQVEHIARKLIDQVSASCVVEGHALSVTPSIGISLFPDDAQEADHLIRHADTAMYHAKQLGRANCRFFSPALNEHSFAKLTLETELRQALERGEFVLHYQPQVSLRSGAIVRAEALIRWRHPYRGMLSPESFLPVAEERGLGQALGRWVLEEGLRQAAEWRRAGLLPLPVAVNVSPSLLRRGGLPELLDTCLAAHGLPGDALEIELAESALMDDTDATLERLRALKARNVRLAIDDFGTGYSSLGALSRFPIDRIKIDHSFIAGLPHAPDSIAIAGAIIDMAQGMGLELVAEGVETPAQRDFLRERRCNAMQGYLVSPALPADQFELFLRTTGVVARHAGSFRPLGATPRAHRVVRRPALQFRTR